VTDPLSGKDDTQRILAYAETLAKESRKALTAEFSQKHKGVPFNTMPQLLRESLLAWYTRRDSNLKLTPESMTSATPGEVRAAFRGEYKRANFKLYAHAKFTLAGGSVDSPSYLRELNVTIAS
jgi:hypothetical protein